jgi:hypothetical protein
MAPMFVSILKDGLTSIAKEDGLVMSPRQMLLDAVDFPQLIRFQAVMMPHRVKYQKRTRKCLSSV